ncbi:CoA-binding protein [Candidatus Micrarchaeota archaeon]|nr:CoA-binding protein [Candidatus Micrarchaeota archaeon]
MKKIVKNLTNIFKPKSVAIIGASPTPNKIGNVILRNFIDNKFEGKIIPVNPKHDNISDLRCYSSVTEVPGKIDCVIIATPAETVPQIIEECCRRKVGGIVILSGGFEEVGRMELAQKIKELATASEIPVIGPNCLGVYNPYTKVDSIFLPGYKLQRPKPGSIAFISQSGAVGSTVMDLSAHYGLGISKFISYGNATVLDESDYLEFLLNDKETEAIILYLEGAKEGRKLLETMKKVNKTKPIIALKAGKGAGAQAAAKSHTGNIAGAYMAYQAAFKQAKVIEAGGINELFNFVKIFNQPKAKGRRVGVITNGGGIGVLTADAIEAEGLELAQFSDATKAELKKILPAYGNVGNPLDLVADADVNGYDKSIAAMMNDPNIDVLVVIVLLQTPPVDERVIHVLSKYVDERKKPIITISIGGAYTEAYRKILESKGVPSYNSEKAAIKALERFVTYGKYQESIRKSE